MKSILVATRDRSTIEVICGQFAQDYKVETAADTNHCLELFRRKRRELAFIDIGMLINGLPSNKSDDFNEALQPYWQAFPTAQVVVLARPEQTREAVAAVNAGAANYLIYPLDPHEVKLVADRINDNLKIQSELRHLRDSAWSHDLAEEARTDSLLMADVLARVKTVASTKTTVLFTGETGTGKSVLAKFLHSRSNRAQGPFIAVHCGAIPDTLLESELYGHEKGAFTGAIRRKLGKFQIADQGTIFLDEIGTLSPAAQIKMLQVLQEKSFTRVGGESPIVVDVRVVAATNTDLKKHCGEGTFREDLYYRLNVFPIDLPPLRERIEDLPILVETFIARLSRIQHKGVRGVDPEVMRVLQNYSWPGNIRELENLIERAYILEGGPLLKAEDFPAELFAFEAAKIDPSSRHVPDLAEVRRTAVGQVERRYLREILALNKGRIDQTSITAGITPRQLHNLMNKYNLHKEDFR